MLAGIVGDVIGSVYEGKQWTNKNLKLIQSGDELKNDNIINLLKDTKWVREIPSWTDDTLCSLALYDAFIKSGDPIKFLQHYCLKYQNDSIGFGGNFTKWLKNPIPYASFANGSIMRIGFIPFLNISLEEKLHLGKKFTEISHNHNDSFKAVHDFILISHYLAQNKNKSIIKNYLNHECYKKTIEDLHCEKKFELNALLTFHQALTIVYESDSFEDILRNSFYVGGDSDTLACIAANLGSLIYHINGDLIDYSMNTLVNFPDLEYLALHFKKYYWKN